MPRTMPITISVVAISRRSRNGPSIWSLNVTPSTPMGIEPTMTSQPICASWSPRIERSVSDLNHAETMRTMSLRK